MKYKSLQQVYGESVRGNVPPRKHLRVLGEAQVEITFDDDNKKIVDMSDEEARKLIKLSDQEERGEVKKWVESGGWDSADAQFLLSQKLHTIYTDTIQMYNAGKRKQFYEQVNDLTELKQSGKINILREALDADKGVNIYKYLNTKLKSRFPLLVGIDSLQQIGQIAFAESAVGVGPGEALLTLFTEGINPAKGDIELPNGDEVELKAGEGRPGKSRVQGLVANFEKFAKEGYVKEKILPEEIEGASKALEVIAKKAEELLQENESRAVREVLEIIQNKNKSIEEQSLKLFAKLKQGFWATEDTMDKNGVPARDYIIKLATKMKQNAAGNTKRAKEFFKSASPDQLVEGLSKFSSRGDEEEVRNVIRRGLKTTSDIGEVALAIAMAFQITEYYDELPHKFTYYTLFNKDNGNIVTWGPFSSDYIINVNRTLDNILSSFDLLKISADSGGRTGYNLGWK